MLGRGEVLNPVSEGGKLSSFLGTAQSVPKAFQATVVCTDTAKQREVTITRSGGLPGIVTSQGRREIVHQGAIMRKWQDELLKR